MLQPFCPDLVLPRPVVGMYWSTMAQFGTWFGGSPAFAIGIQLLPLTPYAEVRDGPGPAFSRSLLPAYEAACDAACVDEGWSVSLIAAKAAAGDRAQALKDALALDDAAFTNAGGNGHSRTNLLYWIATRSAAVEPPPTPAPTRVAPTRIDATPVCVALQDLALAALCPDAAPLACVDGAALGGCAAASWDDPAACARSCKRPI